ncbi:MAG: ORF6N domain-containing protein [Ferruginibacter sp.]
MAKSKKDVIKIISDEKVIRKLYVIRQQKVILDRDLAELYEIETKVLNQAVKRNKSRFPGDFMFQLNKEEYDNLKSQSVTSSWGGVRYMPLAFTEQGVAMLSGVINSPRAIEMNIAIMRAFVEMRKIAISDKNIVHQIKQLVERIDEHDVQLGAIYETIENLLDENIEKKKWEDREKIGFRK